jgi:5-methylcytosine-specific restriction protein A
MNGKILNAQEGLGALHALYRRNGIWYHALRKFPGVLFDATGYVYFDNEKQYLSCLGLKHGPDPKHLHVPGGLSSLAGYKRLKKNNA